MTPQQPARKHRQGACVRSALPLGHADTASQHGHQASERDHAFTPAFARAAHAGRSAARHLGDRRRTQRIARALQKGHAGNTLHRVTTVCGGCCHRVRSTFLQVYFRNTCMCPSHFVASRSCTLLCTPNTKPALVAYLTHTYTPECACTLLTIVGCMSCNVDLDLLAKSVAIQWIAYWSDHDVQAALDAACARKRLESWNKSNR